MNLYREFIFIVDVGEYYVRFNHWLFYYCLHPLPLPVHLILLDPSDYYIILVQKLAITNLALIVFWIFHQWGRKENHLLLEISQPEYGVEYNCKGIIWHCDLFFYDHRALKCMTKNYWRIQLPCVFIWQHLTYRQQSYVWHPMLQSFWLSGFITLGFFTVTD